MKIEEEDFILTPIDNSPFYDLELLYVVNKGKSNEKKEFKVAAYGCTLESAVKRIIRNRVHSKYDTVTLTQYLKDLKSELKTLNI